MDPDIDLSPAGIDNHAMGAAFEELVRRFNEENNEEAGEHWTPRDAVRLMATLVFLPIERQIKSGFGYEVSFTRHFYRPQPLRTLEEISADIRAIEREAEGLLDGVLR